MTDLYDASGNLIPASALKRPDPDPVRVASLQDRYSNNPSYGLTPSSLTEILEEADAGDLTRFMELCEEMEEKDQHLASLLQTRRLAVVSQPWEVIPPQGDETPRAREIAAAAAAMLAAIPDWTGKRTELLDALMKGHALQQIYWRVDGRAVSVSRLEWVHAKFLTYSNTLTPRLRTLENPQGVDLPAFKFLHHRARARAGFDTRLGLGRSVAWIYLLINYAIKDWAGFTELFGQPGRVGHYPAGASDDDKRALLSALAGMGSDFAAAISETMSIELLETASAAGTADLFDRFMGRMEKRMTLAVLGQMLTSEAGGLNGTGSRSLGDTHSDTLQNITEADARALDDTISEQLLLPWCIWNFGPDAPRPRFHSMVEPAEDREAQVALYDKAINQLGMNISQEHLSEILNIPLLQPGETPTIRPAANPFGAPPAAFRALADLGAPAVPASLAEATPIAKMEATKKALMDWTSRNVGPALNAHLAPLRNLIAASSSLDDLQGGLNKLALDPDDLTKAQAQSFALAKLAGRADAARPAKVKGKK